MNSDESNQFSVGLCHEFEITARKAGWEPKDLAVLSKSEVRCRELLAVLRGHSEIKQIDHIIDFDSTPHTPSGWSIREEDQIKSRLRGKWTFDPHALKTYLSKKQKPSKFIDGIDLKDDLEGESVMGAHLLDFYLANPHLIPEEWKGKATFFWGTIYRDSDGNLCVRYLCWDGDRWDWGCYRLVISFDQSDPALLARPPE